MHKVSKAWILNQQEPIITTESFIEISLESSDPDAVANARARDNGSVPFANTLQIVDGFDKNYTRYAMLEHNQWSLDGTFKTLPNVVVSDMGYISNVICNNEGVFETLPIVTIYFPRVHAELIQGITIDWSETLGEFAKEFNVVAYNGTTIVSQIKITNNQKLKTEVFVDIQNYNRIDIEIVRWCLPHRRARIENILVGINITYIGKDMFKFVQTQFCDPLSSHLPRYQIRFELSNINNDFDPNNPENQSKYLLARQRILARYGYMLNGEIEWIPAGTFFLSGWRLPQNGLSATFEARDTLEFMRRDYEKGLFRPNGISLYDLAEELLIEAEIPLRSDGTVNWHISNKLRSIFTTAPLPIKPIANLLQLIANAACCAIFYDREGMLHIDKPPIVSFLGHAIPSHNGAWVNSKIEQITDGIPKEYAAYASAEHNQWSLNEALPIVVGADNTGFVSASICNENGYFESNPVITLTLDRFHTNTVPSMGITWSTAFNEFATEFIITGHGRGAVVAQVHVTDNRDITSNVFINIQNYDLITIEVVKWCLPHRRARIEDFPSVLSYSITHFNSFRRADIELTKPVAGVEVKSFNYFGATNEIELFDGTFNVSGTFTETIRYRRPAITANAVVTGGVLVSAVYYTHSCALTISGSGNVRVVIRGNELSRAEHIVRVQNHDVRNGEWQPVTNELIISTERANAVARWAADYLSSRMVVSPEWRADPRLDVLDVVAVENRFGHRPVRITDLKLTYTGAFRATGRGRVHIE